MNRKAAAVVGVVLVALLAAWRLGWIGKTPLYLAVVTPLTGPGAAEAAGMRNGILLAVEEVNASGGVQGRRVELLQRDEPKRIEEGQAFAQSLIADRRILAVVGLYEPTAYIALHPPLRDGNMPTVLAGVRVRQPINLFGNSTNTEFSAIGLSEQVLVVGARWAWETLGARRYVHVRELGLNGDLDIALFRSALSKAAGQPMTGEVSVTAQTTDFSAVVAQVRSENAEHVFFGGAPSQAALLVRQLRAAGLRTPFQLAGHLLSEEFITLAKEAAEDAVTVFHGLPTEASAGGRAFLERYRQRGFAEPAGWYGMFGYASAQTLLQALELSFLSRPSVAGALKNNPFETVLGPVKYFPGGSSYQTAALYQVKGGRWVPVLVPGKDGKLQPYQPAAP